MVAQLHTIAPMRLLMPLTRALAMSLPLLSEHGAAPAAAPASGTCITSRPSNASALAFSGSVRLLAERCTQLWRLASRAPVVAAVLSLVLVLLQLAIHQDERSWVARGALYDTALLEGHFVQWEWFHVGETVALIEGRSRGHQDISSQNMYRFAGAYAISLARPLLGGLYVPTVASIVLFWLAAVWAIYALAHDATGSSAAAVAGGVMIASAPGFIAYFSNVDAHLPAYAAVAVWLAAMERLQIFREGPSPSSVWLRPIWAGLALAGVGYTLDVAYPLLLFTWLFYGLESPRHSLIARVLAQLALLTMVFALVFFGFRFLVERVLLIHVVSSAASNEPFARVQEQLLSIRAQGAVRWAAEQLGSLALRWFPAFPPPVSLLAAAGLFSVPRRWLLWALELLGSFAIALSLTKVALRELPLVSSAIYLLAAAGAGRIAQVVAWWCAPAGDPLVSARIRYIVLGALVTLVIVTVNADLWGNYSLPVLWFRVQ